MSIKALDNLRDYAQGSYFVSETSGRTKEHLLSYVRGIESEIADRFVELPVDADGKPIHVGDLLDPPKDCPEYTTMQVVRLSYDGYEQEWYFDGEAGGFMGLCGKDFDTAGWTHHHRAPTVEYMLNTFATRAANVCLAHADGLIDNTKMNDQISALAAEYAAKLRLAEEE